MKTAMILPVILLGLSSTSLMANTNNSNMQSDNSNSGKAMDHMKVNTNGPVEIILLDHERITKMIAQLNQSLDSNSIAESRTQFKALQDFLVKHETMEQKAFFPELEKNDQLKSIVASLKDQEKEVDKSIKEIDNTKDDQAWAAKVKDLLKAVVQHATNEQTDLLPKVNQLVDKAKLNEIAKEMHAFRIKHHMN